MVFKRKSTEPCIAEPALKPTTTFPLIAIGASAGGLKALQVFFSHMPMGEKMALVVITHLDRTHFSMLPELLQKVTKLKVVSMLDKMEV